ncbi:MAG: hypothetical protein IIW39_03035 [Clostridia bacterium]|jgi:hypothetical protein|nr:hypothetical protein [Clostridia bacterium]MBQ5837627.1 hypothetical protein [Clostridia bacterium]
MMNFKKTVASKKGCTCVTLALFGALMGFAAAKMLVHHCCCSESLACKAKKAFKAVEEKIAP